ncbi:hypothetical protein AMEX_G5000 [Astyanax mexicanus]|uniref:YqaJ viral recombinase domain-containing protein n=1 Tax=Astyanax mexicanus TaxID=7994 RepID=A0A8T2KXE5_ASTMX|nr:hypothetical protein AMEX_G24965 [Astyanax mexicanus]KAG9271381.1 hypothetical protein AMEX_G14301 [Astyanax mexicanus]KAG9278409.1 hypothetical protein AMEX_G6285 [Astyanax mexicanus]KAG9279475.1 hypothetical protein AMEX_G5000 [Astyanax mexicanus]
MTLVESKFGLVPRGCVLSYQCPPDKTIDISTHVPAPVFPDLPQKNYRLSQNVHFVPNVHHFYHLQSLQVSRELSISIEKETREQSKCKLWNLMRHPRLTASRFHEAAHVRGESSAQALSLRMLKGVCQTEAMKRGLELEPEVLTRYAESFKVNVLPCGLVVHPDAPHLGASPDGKVVDPTENPPFGIVEVKCPNVDSIAHVHHVRLAGGKAHLKKSHKYYSQVQGQLAVTGLAWCDFITDTKNDFTVERIWRDEAFIEQLKEKLDLFYYNVYIEAYLSK